MRSDEGVEERRSPVVEDDEVRVVIEEVVVIDESGTYVLVNVWDGRTSSSSSSSVGAYDASYIPPIVLAVDFGIIAVIAATCVTIAGLTVPK